MSCCGDRMVASGVPRTEVQDGPDSPSHIDEAYALLIQRSENGIPHPGLGAPNLSFEFGERLPPDARPLCKLNLAPSQQSPGGRDQPAGNHISGYDSNILFETGIWILRP